ncbi:hypothetical protein [Nocardioides sp. B-3]|uniref:hypothetical protein n=1 Tax=Nocardioides sp. B-3 TaxID=2895565 RepID=UPI00215292E1|nr:hypothetical protein [Nocardioides sp. B-3]UUZ58901.1 hypothetical protein LP418_23030 [Nocardioides sp. B-3]
MAFTRARALRRPPTKDLRPEISASWRRVRAGGLAPGAEPAVAPLTEGEVESRRTTSAPGSPAREHHRVPEPGGRRRPAGGDDRHRRARAVASRQRWRTPSGRPARLRPRVGVDRVQRRHQRHRHLPGARRAGAHPGPRALRRVAHALELRGCPGARSVDRRDAGCGRHQRARRSPYNDRCWPSSA